METSRTRCPELEEQFPGLEIYLTTNSHHPFGYAIPGADRYHICDLNSAYIFSYPVFERNENYALTQVGTNGITVHDRCEIICQHGGTFLLRDFTDPWDIVGTVYETVEAALQHWYHNRKNNHNKELNDESKK